MPFSFGDYNPVESNIWANIQEVQEIIQPKLTRYHQKTRFQNYKRQRRFHLLDVERFPDNYTLSITGSTSNIYEVKISETTRKFSCSCPDGVGYCQHNNTICKHVYFVLIKVLRMKELGEETSNFFETNQLSEAEKELVFSRLHSVWENREGAADFMNTDYINQFQTHKEKQREAVCPRADDKPNEVLEMFKVKTLPEDRDVCLVCYCEMETPEELVKCTSCRKVFHTSCMQQWFNTGKQNCVHCRSPEWQKYITAQQLEIYGNDPFSRQYQNLSEIIR